MDRPQEEPNPYLDRLNQAREQLGCGVPVLENIIDLIHGLHSKAFINLETPEQAVEVTRAFLVAEGLILPNQPTEEYFSSDDWLGGPSQKALEVQKKLQEEFEKRQKDYSSFISTD